MEHTEGLRDERVPLHWRSWADFKANKEAPGGESKTTTWLPRRKDLGSMHLTDNGEKALQDASATWKKRNSKTRTSRGYETYSTHRWITGGPASSQGETTVWELDSTTEYGADSLLAPALDVAGKNSTAMVTESPVDMIGSSHRDSRVWRSRDSTGFEGGLDVWLSAALSDGRATPTFQSVYLILGLVLGTLGMTILAFTCFICCTKKWKKKQYEEMAEEEDTCDQTLPQFGPHPPPKTLQRGLSLSERFTIPFLGDDDRKLPFRIKEVKMTDTAQMPPSPQHKRSLTPTVVSREKKSSVGRDRPFRIERKEPSRVEKNFLPGNILQQQTESQTLSRRFHCTTTEHHHKAGLIRFFTEYLKDSQMLQVTVSNITDLVTKKGTIPVKPFVRLCLSSMSGNKQKKDTTVHEDSTNPTFEELIEFEDIDREVLAHQKLKIKVYSQQSRNKELLGQVDILMCSLSLYEREMFDIYLYKQKSTITMTSVSITLCHQATFSRFDVHIEKARGVPRGGTGSSIYGAVTLRKGLTTMSQHTSLKTYDCEPEFDEMLTFYNINTDSAEPLSSYTLIFALCERPMMGQDTILGVVVFNMNSPQTSAIKQWVSVQTYPHTRHSWWHYLVAPEEVGATTYIPKPSYAHRK